MDKLWLQDKSWSRTVRSDAKKRMVIMWAFTIAVNVMAFTMAPAAWVEVGPWMAILFPAIAIGLIWYANRHSRQWRRYGVTRLTLDPYPGAIGGHVGGFIELGTGAAAHHNYEVTLECVYSYMSGSGKSRSRRYDIEWEATGPAEVSETVRGLRLEFRFDVPEGLPQSEKKRSTYHFWRVQLRGDQEELPLDRTFDIAVFPTGQHSKHIQADTTAAGRKAAAEEISGALTDTLKAAELRDEIGLSIEQRGDWLRLMFHTGRQKFVALVSLVVGITFLGVCLFGDNTDLPTRLVLGLIGLMATGISVYLPNNALDVRVSPREIKRERSLFGIVIRRQRIRPQQLNKLEIAEGASTFVGDKTTVYYQLVGKGSFGKFRLVDGLADRGLVEAIRDRVMLHAGLRRI